MIDRHAKLMAWLDRQPAAEAEAFRRRFDGELHSLGAVAVNKDSSGNFHIVDRGEPTRRLAWKFTEEMIEDAKRLKEKRP